MFRLAYLLAPMLCLLAYSEAQAQARASREDAVALVQRTIRLISQVGIKPVVDGINSGQRRFLDRDLYLFVHDIRKPALLIAHGSNKNLIGKDTINLRDQNGKYFVREMYAVITEKGKGWVDYRWANAHRTGFEDKTSYVERVGNYFVGVGVYQPDRVNKTTVGIISGNPVSAPTYLQIAYDLSLVLNNKDLRIVPVVGVGGAQNIRDVRALKGIDIGLTQSNVLASYRRNNEEQVGDDEASKIVYIAKLFREEIHIITKAGIKSAQQLKGRKVNLDEIGSGTQFTMRDVFKTLNIGIKEVNMPQTDALEKVKSGEIAATVLVSGKAAPVMRTIKKEDGLRILPMPYAQALGDYAPAEFTSEDYPVLVAEGETISTAAVDAVLIAFNWKPNTDRYNRVSKFAEAFVAKFDELKQPPRHPKWNEVSLSNTLDGWDRFAPMKELLGNRVANRQETLSGLQKVLGNIEDEAERARLFRLFEKWIKSRAEGQIKAN